MKENIEVSTKGLWHHLILSLKGSEEDYTQIDMKKAIFFWLIQIPLAYLLAIIWIGDILVFFGPFSFQSRHWEFSHFGFLAGVNGKLTKFN
jgi:hypothetical protein